MAKLEPVDYDPFAKAPMAQPVLEPVDYDPFAGKDVTKTPTQQQLAPASGVFPAVTSADVSGLVSPQSSTTSYAPPPSSAPVQSTTDPGILAESYGDAVKGLHSTKRGAFLTGFMTGMYDDVDNIAQHLAASQAIEAQYPSSPATRKAAEELETLKDSGAAGILPALGIYARNPRAAASTAIQSLPSMLPSLVTVPVGAAAGSLAGPAGAAAGAFVGLGLGSGAADFGNSFEDYARDKWKPQTVEDWKAILTDPEKYTEAGLYAAKHAGMVGAFDAIGGKLGGKVGMAVAGKLGEFGVGRAGRFAGAAVPAVGTDATVGAAGEAAGQLLGTGGSINDPGAVAGEFAAGVATGGVTSSIEPVAHHFNLGGAKTTPATPEDIAAATAAVQPQMMPTPAPENVSGSIVSGDVTPMFYSPTRKYIEEKGPNAADASQWAATLRNAPGVKQEELADLGLDAFLEGSSGKLTKKELLDHLDENAIRIEETQRDTGLPEPDPGNWNVVGGRPDARYEGYTLPGERQGYTELNLHLPTRNVEGDNTQRDFVGGHYAEPNTVVHARVTDRMDENGVPYALIEEIQSDWHQQGRKIGYQTPVVLSNPRLVDVENLKYEFDGSDGRKHYGWARQAPQGWTNIDATVPAFNPKNATEQERINEAMDDARRFVTAHEGARMVDGPFKSSWDELAFKRMLRWAVDKGYRRVAWVNAEQAAATQRHGEVKQGIRRAYDVALPSIAKKWAKRLGGVVGQTVATNSKRYTVELAGEEPRADGSMFQVWMLRSPEGNQIAVRTGEGAQEKIQAMADRANGNRSLGQVVNYVEIPQAGVDLIQRGLPMYSEVGDESKRRKPPGATLDELAAPPIQTFMKEFTPAVDELTKRFKIGVPVKLYIHPGFIVRKLPDGRVDTVRNALGLASMWGNKAEIHIALKFHNTAAEVWATITHEFGHIVMQHKFATAPAETRIAIRAAYDEFRANSPHNENMHNLIQRRDNAIIAFHNTRRMGETKTLNDMGGPQQRQYWVSFEEWFAEQTARWATATIHPLTLVEKFFAGLGKQILSVLKAATEKFGVSFEPHKAMSDWLNSFHTDAPPFAQDAVTVAQVQTQAENQPKMGPEEKAVERQPETIGAREGIDKLFVGRPPREVQEAAAYADKFNKIYKWMLGIHQVAQRNAHIQPLQEYTETIAVAQLTKQQIMIRAQEVLKAWNRLGGRQADAVAALIDDVQNMVYLTPDEVKQGVVRFPRGPEMAALIKKHDVSQEGLAVFKQVADTFGEHLTRYEAVLRNEALKITDPAERQKRMDAITKQIANLRSRPYFPAMRFGDYTITVRNQAGQVIHFETFERERKRNLAADAIRTQYGVSRDQMELGKLDKQVKPLMGVPTQLLELMAAKLQMSKQQRDALEQMKFELSPAQSFKHRFQHKQRIAGYSQDFRRAYAAYFFHGANHLMKAMYADRLRGLMQATRDETKGVYDVTTRHEIVAYMNDHLENWLDPKSDWAAVRSIAFLWSLAWTPAAAAQNLTQTLMTTYPFLAQQFGDVKAVGALARAGADFTTYYKKGTLHNATEFELKALGQGIKDGIINEAMAPELAGFAEGRTLGVGFGGNELQRGLHTFNEWGAKMFEMAEQVNRRLVFRATLKLVQENPGNKYAKDMVTKHKLHYDQLRREGWTEAEATAYVAARDSTITTQFQYGREYAPRFMRGKIRSIFVFKTFIQNYVVFLANYPQAAVRTLLIMGFLGGLMGVPGADDLKEILKAIGWRMFGKDFDLEKEARHLIIQMLGEDENGRVAADLILHGTARQGYGIPAFMDMLGGTVGIDVPMPTFDRSKAISAGTLLPVELGKMFGPPVQDQDAVISAQAQKASGAVFGAGFNVYKALTNNRLSWDDSKRWERAVPRALGSLAKAYRVGTEGRERTGTGSTLVKYDVRDTEQLMEVIGMAMGYTPYRQALQWDRVMAGQEVVKLWDIRRTGLMKQFGNAVMGKDEKEIERVKGAIKEFNSSLPQEARGKAITSDTLRQSVGTQARTRAAQEAESSVKKSDIPILREVQKLYPESRATSIRRVPQGRQ